MKKQILFLSLAALMMAGCSSEPKETTPAPAAAEATPAPTPAPLAPEAQACEGKAAKDACSFAGEKGEVKGTCVRSETYALACTPKAAKATKGKKK